MKLSVVIPAHNEAESIGETVAVDSSNVRSRSGSS